MEYLIRRIGRTGIFGWLYAANLFLALQFFVIHFINSSFLGTFVPEEKIGLVFAIGSGLALLTLGSATIVLSKFGAWRTLLGALLIQFTLLLGLAFVTKDTGLLLVLFTTILFVEPVALFILDIILEASSKTEETTGNVRGIFLTMATGASLFAPLVAGFLAGPSAVYGNVYFASALVLMPCILIVLTRLRTFVDPPYRTFSIVRTFARLASDGNVRNIAVAQFLMRFFFSWMVIYLPLYLHTTIGFSWPQIGIILTIMFTPYLLIEIPAGILADRYLGEQELLIAGFIVTGFFTILLLFVSTPNLLLWAWLLFMTRVGTALIEITTESYFFKHMRGSDADTISFFRMLRPFAYAVGPLSASLLLLTLPLHILWPILGCIMLCGTAAAAHIVDTK